tara:strand:+ start:266 stop:940 length:675 start_codon:yes stop_codon:yes gene_type:complete
MINLITVCTDAYPMIYAEKLHRQFANLTQLDVSHWCITDRPLELSKLIKPIAPFKKSKGWWNKINLYNSQMPKGYILYMDLDIVILNNFDQEIIEMTKKEETMCCVSDAINWMGVRFSSSLMCFESGVHSEIFEKFKKKESEINELKGGDQVWTGPQLNSVCYIDDFFPNLKKNFKFHLAKRDGNNLTLPLHLDEKIKLVDCGGKPKPHELEALPYIKRNWHDV